MELRGFESVRLRLATGFLAASLIMSACTPHDQSYTRADVPAVAPEATAPEAPVAGQPLVTAAASRAEGAPSTPAAAVATAPNTAAAGGLVTSKEPLFSPISFNFPENMARGATGEPVFRVQNILNRLGCAPQAIG